MSDTLICKMPGCGGELGDRLIPLQTGCTSSSPCRACSLCGRVHSYEGFLMFNRPGAAVYQKDEGLVLVMEPKSFEKDKAYSTKGYLNVCLESGQNDCQFTDMVELEPETSLIFDGMDEEVFRFHREDGTIYRLHRGDVNLVE